MQHRLRILSIEDDPKDTELIQDLLETENIACDVTRVDTQAALVASVEQGGIDLILADYRLPSFDGISALKFAMKACPDVPFIFVSGTLGEEVAIEALKIGATDYVLKTSLSRLVPSVQRALREGTQRAERKRAEEALRQSEAYLAEAQRLSHTGSFGWKPSTGAITWSEETFRIFQYDRTTTPTIELILQRVHPEDAALVQQTVERATQDEKDFEHEYRLRMPDGSVKHLHVVARALKDERGAVEFVGAVRDVTAAKRAEKELRQSEEFLLEAQRLSHTGSWRVDFVSGAVSVSPEVYRIHDVQPDEDPSNTEFFFSKFHPEDRKRVVALFEKAQVEKTEFEVDYRIVLPDGTSRYLHTTGHPVLNESGELIEFVGTTIDVTAAKLAGQTLRESEAYLAEAQRLSHTGSWARVTATGEMRYWSEECYRVLGFDPLGGAPPFETFLQRVHPDDQARVREITERAGREKAEYELDYRIVHPAGEIRNIHAIGHPVFSPSGDLVEFVGSVMDITERKRGEALREGERRVLEMIARDAPLEEILEKLVGVVEGRSAGMLCSVLLLDADGQHVRHGAAPSLPKPYIAAIDGLSIGPQAGSCGTAMYRREPVVVTDILQDPLWEPYRAVAEGYGLRACWSTPILAHSGKALGSFAMYYREPRSPIPAESRVMEMATHLAGIAIERKLTHEQLRRSEAYLAEAQRLTHTGSWVWEVAGQRALHLSDEWYRIYGFDPNEGTPAWNKPVQRIHPDDRARFQQVRDRAITEKSDYEVEYRILFPDGAVKHIRSVGHPVLDASGKLVQFVGSSTDITERRQAEEALRQAQEDLARISRITTMGELTASLAHEVNQPIAAAVTDANTCLRWLTREQPDLKEARQAASRIVKDATRAAEIISRVRQVFSKDTPQRALVDVNEVIREMITLLSSEAVRHSISIRTELANVPQVMADRVQLQQVLMNLMINAIDAMKDAEGTRNLILCSQQAEDGQLMVSVSDTGVGLTPQAANQIFNAFFTTKPHGTGMGLRISRSIVESHGGRLWSVPNSSRGVSFRLTLPTKSRRMNDAF
jgi:PAS domain S-box-containing protein